MVVISGNDLNTMRSIINSTALAAFTAWITASLCANIPHLLYSDSATQLKKPEIDPPFSEAAQDRDLRKELMYHQWHYEDWDQHWMPESCLVEAELNKLSGSDFRVRTVWYDDCKAPWIVCRHTEAKEPWDTLLSTLGQVPVGMRQYLSDLVILPGASTDVENSAAYTRGTTMVFTPSFFKLGVLFHEFTHILDAAAITEAVVAQGFTAGNRFSLTPSWKDAFDNDTHVPTAYAKMSYQEDFADVGRWAMSDLTHAAGLAAYSRGWTGCQYQILSYKSYLAEVIFTKDMKCSGKVEASEAVPVPGVKVVPGAGVVARPKGTLEGTGVKGIVVPFDVQSAVHIYFGAVPVTLGY